MSYTRKGAAWAGLEPARTCFKDRRATDYSTTHRSLEAGSNRRPSRYEGGALAKLSYPGVIDSEPRAHAVILDTIGELAHLYQIATAVFVGGSLVDQGGHNVLEPAVYGKPVVFGPHMQNFAEIADAFVDQHAAIQVDGPADLSAVVLRLIGDPVERARLGAAARALVEANRGATPRTLEAIAALLPPPGRRGVVRPFRRN